MSRGPDPERCWPCGVIILGSASGGKRTVKGIDGCRAGVFAVHWPQRAKLYIT